MSDPEDRPERLRIGRVARTILWFIEYDRSTAAAIARENYIRRLMGLPPKPTHRDTEGEGTPP